MPLYRIRCCDGHSCFTNMWPGQSSRWNWVSELYLWRCKENALLDTYEQNQSSTYVHVLIKSIYRDIMFLNICRTHCKSWRHLSTEISKLPDVLLTKIKNIPTMSHIVARSSKSKPVSLSLGWVFFWCTVFWCTVSSEYTQRSHQVYRDI